MVSLEFLVTSLIVVLIPGTGVIYEPGSSRPLLQLLLLCAVFMAMTFVVFVVYGFVAHAFRSLVIESANVQHWLRYGFAAAFASLGAKLALAER